MPRDLLVTGATLVDVVTQTSYLGWFTVADGRFVEVEAGRPSEAEVADLDVTNRLDLGGAWVQPGMLDVHMHIESSLVTPRRFAEAALPRGTTTVLQDPHEVANVLGAPGIRWMIEASRGLPLRGYSAVSSCVPATSAEIETANASITPHDVTELAREPGVIALGEVMDFHGLAEDDPHLMAMVAAATAAGLSVEGHVPSLTGPELSRYVRHGIRSDHTLATPAKVMEELRKGMWVMIQEKSLTSAVVRTIRALPDRSRVLLITDDVMPNRLGNGHLDRLVRIAIELGWGPYDAIASATLRPATYLGLHDLGITAPGARADFLVCSGLAEYPPQQVYVGGRLVAEDGVIAVEVRRDAALSEPSGLMPSFAMNGIEADSFRIRTRAGERAHDGAPTEDPDDPPTETPIETFTGSPIEAQQLVSQLVTQAVTRPVTQPVTKRGTTSVQARVIVVNPSNSFTRLETRSVELADGVPTQPDLALATVIPRAALRARPFSEPDTGGATEVSQASSGSTGRYQPVMCLVAGLGLEHGAFATSFAHDSHNVFVLGREPEAMAAALRAVVEAGGGMAFAPGASVRRSYPANGNDLTLLRLPLAGLLSDRPVAEVGAAFEHLEQELRGAGVSVKHPILLLTLLPLSVSPDYKVSDKGVVDVQGRRILTPLVAP